MTEGSLLHARLVHLLSYDKLTGNFVWLVKRGNQAAGNIANSVDGKGYIRIRIDGFDYRAHRLAWFYVHGVWPVDQIDHADLDRRNNAFINLREADNSLNNANRRVATNNTSGFKGVRYEASRKKWRAEIKKDGKCRHLGRYGSSREAVAAYAAAAAKCFGQFSRTN